MWNSNNTDAFFSKGEDLGYFEHLKVIHFNNSKYPAGSKKERHANIFHNSYIKEKTWKAE
jgi:deoxyribonuclease IV